MVTSEVSVVLVVVPMHKKGKFSYCLEILWTLMVLNNAVGNELILVLYFMFSNIDISVVTGRIRP